MIVEEIRVDRENFGKFPVGLRVLAVDDDPICLKLLETLLRKCQYHVTTTNQAQIALNMLRENKDRFDLVISDVHMPDMDGFKLLELVGLEMDLPVIMLSANSDPKLVMKGVSHGACDYLVKPVRIEELRNIWQHVLRRRNFESKNQNASSDPITSHPTGGSHMSSTLGNGEQNGKFNRKRKDETEDETEDNGNESEDPTTQKKPRVVWSIELHRKFVAAVNQLGIEKAVPKRILDMMNVEGLTRENVASHLQKYRLFLKRISHVTTQQANMAAVLGVNDSPFMRIGSFAGLGDFRTLAGSERLANVSVSSYATGGMLGRLNSPANVNIRSLTPSTMISQSHAPKMSNSIISSGKTHSVSTSTCQNPSLFHGIPSSLELDQLQPKSIINFTGMEDSKMLSTSNAFTDPGEMIGRSIGLLGSTANKMMFFNSESFNSGVAVSSNLLDQGKCDEMWRNSIESSKIQPNSTISTNPYHSHLSVNINVPFSNDNSMVSSVPIQDSRETGAQDMVSDSQNINITINQRWREQKPIAFGSLNSQIPSNGLPLSNRIQDQSSAMFNRKMDVIGNGSLNVDALNVIHQNEHYKSGLRFNGNFLVEQTKLQSGFIHQGYDSLDDLMNSMIKREQDETMPNCDFGFEDYSFGQGI